MVLPSRNYREKKTIRHSSKKSGFSDCHWHCGLRHTREGLHQWTWHMSMDTCGERFSRVIIGRTMQWPWLLFVADRRNFQISKRKESNRMQHRKLRLHGCSYQTEGSTIHGILDSQGKPWEQEVEDAMLDLLQPFTEGVEERDASSRTPAAGSDPAHEVVEEQSHGEKLPRLPPMWWERYSGRRYQE